MQTASEKHRMIVADVETLRLHYAIRCGIGWRGALPSAREIVALYDERFFRMWEFYLAGATVMFEGGTGCKYQVQYLRDRRALPITRDYMVEAEQRYRHSAP
jgi:cyclopropane-fatty-acyl-phospholipid synthase